MADDAVVSLLGFGLDVIDVDFDALVIEVTGIGNKDGGFFFVNAALRVAVAIGAC
jgi:hypothetical protein